MGFVNYRLQQEKIMKNVLYEKISEELFVFPSLNIGKYIFLLRTIYGKKYSQKI